MARPLPLFILPTKLHAAAAEAAYALPHLESNVPPTWTVKLVPTAEADSTKKAATTSFRIVTGLIRCEVFRISTDDSSNRGY